MGRTFDVGEGEDHPSGGGRVSVSRPAGGRRRWALVLTGADQTARRGPHAGPRLPGSERGRLALRMAAAAARGPLDQHDGAHFRHRRAAARKRNTPRLPKFLSMALVRWSQCFGGLESVQNARTTRRRSWRGPVVCGAAARPGGRARGCRAKKCTVSDNNANRVDIDVRGSRHQQPGGFRLDNTMNNTTAPKRGMTHRGVRVAGVLLSARSWEKHDERLEKKARRCHPCSCDETKTASAEHLQGASRCCGRQARRWP
jgi:hypothetical protein